MPHASGARLSWDDLRLLPEDGLRHEIIDGEHFVTPSPVWKHQAIVTNVGVAIHSYLRTHPIGTVMFLAMDVILSPHDVVEPDLLYFSRERERTFEPSDWVKGAPNLVMEVASPSAKHRDETLKRRLYERFGVDEYWLVDPDTQTVVVLQLENGSYREAARLTAAGGDALTTPLLPGWTLVLKDLLEA